MSQPTPEPTPTPAPAPAPQPAPAPAPAPAPQPAPAADPNAVQRPDGITDDVWNALGDPGRQALVAERTARQAAEHALAAARARPKPPGTSPAPAPAPTPAPAPAPQPGTDPQAGDIVSIVTAAVSAAMKPFQDAETQRQNEAAADRIATTVLDAAKLRFIDPTDALSQIDVTQITDGAGNADPAKITSALDNLLARKPHLGLGPREGQPGVGAAPPPPANADEQVKAILQRMQATAGIRTTSS